MSLRQKYTLIYNFSSLGFIQGINFLLSLVVIPYVINIVGADGFGVIAVAQVLMFYLSVTADYGFNRTAIRDVALFKDDRNKISRIFFTVLFSKLFICLLAFLLLVILVNVVPLFRTHSLLYMMAFAFVAGQALLVNWFFQGLEKMQYVAFASLFSRLLFVGMVILFLREKADAWMYIFMMGLGNILAGLISIYAVIRFYQLKFYLPKWSDLKYEFKEGWPVTVTNLSQTTIQYIGIFILRLFTNDLVVGYYSIAERIYFAMKLMLDVFQQAAYPRVCLIMQNGLSQVIQFFRRAYAPFLGLVSLASAIVLLLAPAIIKFFLGQPNDQSTLLLRLFALAIIIVCLNIPACLVLLAGDHKKDYLKVFTVGTIVNIAANLILTPWLQAMGTVIAVLVTELFITAYLYREVYRIYRVKDLTGWRTGLARKH